MICKPQSSHSCRLNVGHCSYLWHCRLNVCYHSYLWHFLNVEVSTAVLFVFVWLTMTFLSISIKWFVAHHRQPYGLLLVMKNLTSSFFKEIHSSFFVCPVLCWCSEKIKTIVRCKHFVKNVMNRIKKNIQYQWNCKISPNIKFLFSADVNAGSYTDRTMTERISTQCVHVCSTWLCTTLYMHTDM